MKKYEYQILRYIHDQFTGEFVNIGVVVFSHSEHFLKARMSSRYSRITSLFPQAKGRFIASMAKNLEYAINNCDFVNTKANNLFDITKAILPVDDSALQFTETKFAIHLDLEIATSHLYAEMVGKYLIVENSVKSLTDDEVWKLKYRDLFDKYQISKRLEEYEIATKNDHFVFDKSWKNEIWHCYQPISFDLQNMDTIKDKVYRWSGKLKEIKNTDLPLHLTFLSSISSEHHSLETFVKDSLQTADGKFKVDVIMDTDAENLVKKIQQEMQSH